LNIKAVIIDDEYLSIEELSFLISKLDYIDIIGKADCVFFKRRNKIFFITIIVSFLLHLWGLQALNNFFDFSYPVIKERPILSAKIEFVSIPAVKDVKEYSEKSTDIQSRVTGMVSEVTDFVEMKKNKETENPKKENEVMPKKNDKDDLLEKIQMPIHSDIKEELIDNEYYQKITL